jgi:probable DNA repair protein
MQEEAFRALKKGAVAITATRRLARSLRQEYNSLQQARGIKAWEAPEIKTWSDWTAELWHEFLPVCEKPKALLNSLQELILWERIIGDSPESREMMQSHAISAAAQDAWRLAAQWKLDLRQAESLGNEDVRAFLAWARRFAEICDAERWLDPARLVDELKDVSGALRLPSTIQLAGFDEYSPQQESFLKCLSERGCKIVQHPVAALQHHSNIFRVSLPDPEREMEAAARWARTLLEAESSGRIGVVVVGLASRRNMVERIFRSILEPGSLLAGERPSPGLINISAGNALGSYPMIQNALSLLSLSPDENDWIAISNLLRNSHIRGSDSESTHRARLDVQLRRNCSSRIEISRLRRACRDQAPYCPLMDRAIEDWLNIRAPLNGRKTIGQWARIFSSMLEAFGWPGERPLSSGEFQTMQAWNELLSYFASADLTGASIRFERALSLLKRLSGQIIFQPETEPAGVQILGPLEAAGLTFDNLWIAGLHDEVWPGSANPNPLLPVSMQREQKLPRCSPERELEFTGLVTARLLASGSEIILSSPEHEADRELDPSPLIASIPAVELETIRQWNGDSTWNAIKRRSAPMEELIDEKGPPILESSRQRGGTKVFQYQAGCPFRAFVELRLGAEQLEHPAPGLDPRQRGVLVHSALEEIWKQLRTHSALCLLSDLSEPVLRAVDCAINRFELERGTALPKRFASLERERLRKLMVEWLEFEKFRPPFEVVQPESELFAELNGIRFKVKIDRIDRLPDSREIILDYKTGMPNLNYWESARPEEPQLPLYSTIHKNQLAGVLFAQIKPGRLRFIGLVNEDIEIPGAYSVDLADRIRTWRGALEKLAFDFRTGRAEVDPKNPSRQCHYCPLTVLCRVAEIEDAQDEEDLF